MMLSSAQAELVVGSNVKKISTHKEVEKKEEDETEIQEKTQESGSGKGVEKKLFNIASDMGASGKEVELGEKEEPEEVVTEALLVHEKSQMKEKMSLRGVKRTESEQVIGGERDV